jgi:hypothetical protein
MPDRTCIFCGAKGPLTHEHIIPEWASTVLLGPDPADYLRIIHADYLHGVEYSKKRADLAPVVVCGGTTADCNSGWMEDREDLVRPFFKKMMVGRPQSLTMRKQAMTATWAVMKAMTAEYLGPVDREKYWSQSERAVLRRSKNPPDGVMVWLGRSITNDAGFMADQKIEWAAPDGGPPIPGYAVLIAMGQLIVLVFAHRLRLGARFSGFTFDIPFDRAAVPVWPQIKAQRWPPQMVFDQNGIDDWFKWATTVSPTAHQPINRQRWNVAPDPRRDPP